MVRDQIRTKWRTYLEKCEFGSGANNLWRTIKSLINRKQHSNAAISFGETIIFVNKKMQINSTDTLHHILQQSAKKRGSYVDIFKNYHTLACSLRRKSLNLQYAQSKHKGFWTRQHSSYYAKTLRTCKYCIYNKTHESMDYSDTKT